MTPNSRRKLLQTGVAAAVLAASGLPFSAQAGAVGGRLRIGLADGHVLEDFAPRKALSAFMSVAGQGAIFDTLTEVSPEGALRGELADNWRPSEDARIWTIALRADVRFHDGAEFSAEDVVASFDLHRASGSAAPVLSTIESVRAMSAQRVRFVLREGNADFPWLLSHPALVIHSARTLAHAGPAPNGTGLYRLEQFVPGERLRAKRVADHYKQARAGWFECVELTAIPQPGDRVSALVSGQVDVIHDLAPRSAARLAADPRFSTLVAPDAACVALELRGPDAPGFKAALARRLDRGRIVEEATGPLGRVAYDVPVPGFEPAAAGTPVSGKLPDALRLALDPDLGATGARVTSAVVRQLREVGIKVSLTDDPAQASLIARRIPLRPTEDWTWMDWAAQGPAAGPGLDARLALERARLGAPGGDGGFEAVAREVAQTSAILVPCFVAASIAWRRDLAMPRRAKPMQDLDGARIAERWWRA